MKPTKPSERLRALLIASCLTASVTRAAGPQPVPVPDVQALMVLLNRLTAESAAAQAAAPEDAPGSAAAVVPPPVPVPATKATAASPLRTSGLTISTLTPSTGLSGRGAALPIRLTEADWRALFTTKPTQK